MDESQYVAVLSVSDEAELRALSKKAEEKDIQRTCVLEPDLDNALTAIALEPTETAKKLCSNLPLALRGVIQ